MHVWAVGGNQSTQRKPTQALGEHAKPCALIWTKGQISLSCNLPSEAWFKWLRSIQSFLSENPSSKSGCSHCSPVKYKVNNGKKNAYWVALILTDCYFNLLEGLSQRQITARLKQDSALDSFDHNCTVFFQSIISQTKSNHTIKDGQRDMQLNQRSKIDQKININENTTVFNRSSVTWCFTGSETRPCVIKVTPARNSGRLLLWRMDKDSVWNLCGNMVVGILMSLDVFLIYFCLFIHWSETSFSLKC